MIANIATVVTRLVAIPTTEVGLMSFAADLLTAPATPIDTYFSVNYD